jgi:hypothetical protein
MDKGQLKIDNAGAEFNAKTPRRDDAKGNSFGRKQRKEHMEIYNCTRSMCLTKMWSGTHLNRNKLI